jgi:riboflavin kinase/FMN adenylyltransferase
MKVIFGIGKVKRIRRAVVALGVFDGLHLGHLKVLKNLTHYAKRIKGKSVVITFSPHPQQKPDIYSLEHRLRLLQKIAIDLCIVIKFTPSFARISATEFIKNFLIKKIHPFALFVGENFTFGTGAAGDPALLRKFAKRRIFRLKTFPVYKVRKKTISSTYIRRLILDGKLSTAASLLGRPVSILGTVITGSRLARYLGFPTANIKPHHEVLPPAGVYLVKVIFQQEKFKGLCYIGTRPTLKKPRPSCATHIEVHIFEFRKNIYAKKLEIQFMKKIRPEKRFASLKLLTRQIRKDIALAQTKLERA